MTTQFKTLFYILTLLLSINLKAQEPVSKPIEPTKTEIAAAPKTEKKWYENISIRGYGQVRYNRLLETNENLTCEQCDRSWGKNGGFFLRRLRLVFYGQVHKNVYFYIQPDLAASVTNVGLHYLQLRDAYFDVGLDSLNEFRFRIGQSKVPYGFENLQSSQNRLTLDRNDALNSGVANERDMGLYFMWAPHRIRKLFSTLVSSGLKGSGDYGVLAIGAFNGQTANSTEQNNDLHYIARLSYPFELGSQILELGIQAYTGRWVIPTSNKTSTVKHQNDYNSYLDERYAATVVLYPKPFGFQSEITMGTGPQFNSSTMRIEEKPLYGGYALINYMINYKKQTIIPFVKYQMYEGGKKHELDARSYSMNELEIGAEWQVNKNFELTVQYTISRRNTKDGSYYDNLGVLLPNKLATLQEGNLLRIQAQVNF